MGPGRDGSTSQCMRRSTVTPKKDMSRVASLKGCGQSARHARHAAKFPNPYNKANRRPPKLVAGTSAKRAVWARNPKFRFNKQANHKRPNLT